MIRWLLLGPYRLSDPWLRHPNLFARRIAQIAAFGVAIVWLVLPGAGSAKTRTPGTRDALADEFLASPRMVEFLHGTAIVKPIVGPICRWLALRLSVYAKTRHKDSPDSRNFLLRPTGFLLRLTGPVGQLTLRNLLLWQNHVLPLRGTAGGDIQVDVALALAGRPISDARLFDLYSVALMLERVRNFSVFWDEETAVGAASAMMSEQELSTWRESRAMDELGKIPRDVTRRVAIQGTSGGIKLLSYGRKYANDFMKLAFPGRFIIAVGLREAADGTVPPEELEYWLTLVDEFHAQHPSAGFVMLNCLAPSQWRQWPAHLRFARHQGLTLQDTICLAQIADGYLGVLDICGLVAHSAGRPGVYVPLEEGELGDADSTSESSQRAQIMVASGRRADIQVALEKLATLSPVNRAYQ